MSLLEGLTAKVGKGIAAVFGTDEAKASIFAKHVYQDGSLQMISPDGEKLIPRGDLELIAYHLPGDRKPSRNSYNQRTLEVDFSLWIFGSISIEEGQAWSIQKKIESIKEAEGKSVKLKMISYSFDIASIIGKDFAHLKDQFQDKQTITTALKIKYKVQIQNCC